MARDPAAWKGAGGVLQGGGGELWSAAVDIVRQVGASSRIPYSPQSGAPSGTTNQLPCRLRAHATQIKEAWETGAQQEYGVGPAELQALQDMAAKWRQDVQHDHWRPAYLMGGSGQGQRLWVDTTGKTQFLEGQWECQGTHGGSPVWRHTKRHLHMSNPP